MSSYKNWKDHNFTAVQAQSWIKAGLKTDEYGLVSQLMNNNISLTQFASKFKSSRDAQEWVDCFYPLETRKEITKLDISKKELTGSLKLEGFSNLTEFICYRNYLNKLDLSACLVLTKLVCNANYLTGCDFLTQLNPANLKELFVHNNNFSSSDLTVFSHLVNLELLYSGSITTSNYSKWENNRNRWNGSLACLQKLTKLKTLSISNTNIDSGLEYLPDSLESFYCRRTKLANELSFYGKPDGDNHLQLFQAWKKAHPELMERAKIPTLEKEILRLTNIIKQQKNKVIEAYLYSFNKTEKPLVKELIEAHLELTRIKEQRLPSFKCKSKCWELEKKLVRKFGEEVFEKVQLILIDCEKLINYEAELVQEISKNQLMLESTKQQINHYITYFNAPINVNQGNVIIGNSMGDNTNLSHKTITYDSTNTYQTKIEEITEEFHAHTLQPPYAPPSSSKNN